jgi:hypothetical protein
LYNGNSRFTILSASSSCALLLGCSHGVLNPQGPVGADEKVPPSSVPTRFGPRNVTLALRVVAAFGFWLFLLSDIIIFSALFAAYAVLCGETNGGPSAVELFDKRHVLLETGCLLASSFTCGMMMIATEWRAAALTYFWALVTAVLGNE